MTPRCQPSRPEHPTHFYALVIKSGDPVEQEKQLKYASLVANTIMLSNITDLTDGSVLHGRGRHRRHLGPRRPSDPYMRGARPPLRAVSPST